MKLQPHLIFLLLTITLGFSGFAQDENFLLAYVDSTTEGNLIGYKNVQGEIVIPPKFQDKLFGDSLQRIILSIRPETGSEATMERAEFTAPFIYCGKVDKQVDGLTRFVVDGKIGYKNAAGEVVIKSKYDFIGPFENGFAHYCIGGESIFFRGNWFWDGNLHSSGYINTQGKEYDEKEEILFENGETKTVSYRLTPIKHNCRAERETFTFYESGNIQSYFAIRTHPNCAAYYTKKLHFHEKGDTVWRKVQHDGRIQGEFRLGHADYYIDSTGERINDWFPIRSIWDDGKVTDFLNENAIYLGKNYGKVSERRMKSLINSKKVDWTFTYIAREVFDRSGQQITFIIHPKNEPYSSEDREKLQKQEDKISKHWVCREFNRLIYHSDSILLSFVDTIRHDTSATLLSKRDHKSLVKSFYNHGKYGGSWDFLPPACIKIVSFNEKKASTTIWLSEETGHFYVSRGGNYYIKMELTEKVAKKVKRLVKKYDLRD